MEGKIFSELVVIRRVNNKHISGGGNASWLCRCSCNALTEVRGSYLRSGKTKSCGHFIGKTCLSQEELSYETKLKYWGQSIRTRDGNKCKKCGETQQGINLHAHHIIPKEVDPSKVFDMSNGITLCSSCHKKEHLEREMI